MNNDYVAKIIVLEKTRTKEGFGKNQNGKAF
jgi:hypothetical protein